jgi:hypothetical protein
MRDRFGGSCPPASLELAPNICSNDGMRWDGQAVGAEDGAALPGLGSLQGLLRTVTAAEFPGVRFHEVAARSALNAVPAQSPMPFRWTINPYRGCTHACA